MNIGDVELPIVADIEVQEEADVTEIKDGFKHLDSTPVKHSPSVDTIIISGFTNQEVHSGNLSLSEQKSRLKALRKNDVTQNSFTYGEFNGYLLIEDVSFSDTSDSKIINDVEITARYFPWPKYYQEDKP